VQKPSPGRIVIARVDPLMNNGSDEAPAVITRVWSDTTINVRVLLDAFTTPLWLSSIRLLDERPADRGVYATWWPPRV